MEILAIDSGNTRIKWGYWDGSAWTRIGALTHDESARMEADFAALRNPQCIAIANVAGVGAAQRIEKACARFAVPLVWASSQLAQCGVRNHYEDPAQLGADRWAALIGAWHHQQSACLVVGAGTATTADLLSARGEFLGGVIFPGARLMKRSLAENTARLPFAEGSYVARPRNTADAIETGVMLAQAGAIERMFEQLSAAEAGEAICLLSGGAATKISAALVIPHHILDQLVLDGLARIAVSTK